MKSYFLITDTAERDIANEYRVQWLIHREAVLKFMEKVGGVEVRTNHVGQPIAVRFERGKEIPEGFRKTEWGSSGARLINMKGDKLFADDIKHVTALWPKFPEHLRTAGFFDIELVWINENSPIYVVAQHDAMVGKSGYFEITVKEFNFRMALDEFKAEDSDRAELCLITLKEYFHDAL